MVRLATRRAGVLDVPRPTPRHLYWVTKGQTAPRDTTGNSSAMPGPVPRSPASVVRAHRVQPDTAPADFQSKRYWSRALDKSLISARMSEKTRGVAKSYLRPMVWMAG